MRYPGQEAAVVDYYQRNPQALEAFRAPLFEEKVVDYLIGKATVTDKPVSVEELLRDDDGEAEAAK
jgi:trigger factor